MAIYYRIIDQLIIVSGKTYPYRDQIKDLGGRFESTGKVWQIQNQDDNLQRIDKLCKAVGGGKLKSPPIGNGSPSTSTSLEYKRTKAVNASLEGNQAPAKANPLHQTGMSIGELMQSIQLKIQEAYPRSVWVIGEIQNFNLRAKALFFQLADFKEGASQSATTSASCVMWRSTLEQIRTKLSRSNETQDEQSQDDPLKGLLQDGIRIRALVSVRFYKDRGSVSLVIEDIDPRYTKGALALAREELLREMRQKGLDRKNSLTYMSSFPFHIGLISAEGSRAKTDFLDQLLVYKFPGYVTFFPAHTQGEQCIKDVCRGIKELSLASCDIIVITRGGGSLADLRWFDSREIAVAIAESQIPIVSAIGHHEDVCVAEYMSYRREKTPTAAADYLLSLFQSTKEKLDIAGQILIRKLAEAVRQTTDHQNLCIQRLQNVSNQALFHHKEKLTQYSIDMRSGLDRRTQTYSKNFENLSYKLRSLSRDFLHQSDLNLSPLYNALERSVSTDILQKLRQTERFAVQIHEQSSRRHYGEEQNLAIYEKTLIGADPKPWLAKGWTQLKDDLSMKVSSIEDIKIGQTIKAQLKDGKIELKVTSKTPSQNR